MAALWTMAIVTVCVLLTSDVRPRAKFTIVCFAMMIGTCIMLALECAHAAAL